MEITINCNKKELCSFNTHEDINTQDDLLRCLQGFINSMKTPFKHEVDIECLTHKEVFKKFPLNCIVMDKNTCFYIVEDYIETFYSLIIKGREIGSTRIIDLNPEEITRADI